MYFNNLDFLILGIYCIGIIGLAQYVSRDKSGIEKTSEDYFLAGRSLPWWAIGASLIAANISAEQIIGMSGQGFVVGMAIAVWELTAAVALIVMAKYFLPLFLEKKIYTMPQFLEQRFDKRVSLVLSVFWLIIYVFINLTTVLWLGALAINSLTGLEAMYGCILLAVFALAYSLSGGLKAVAMTDIVQVVLLIFGGFAVLYIALNQISGSGGVIQGLGIVFNAMPEKFDMILSRDNPHYASLPGLSVLLGGMWIMNISYWGFNQYIIQRALAAKNIQEAQKGIAFAAFLKLLMPVIVVLPGIAIFVLNPTLATPDHAYPEAMAMLPSGIKGLVFAALLAAIVSSLASMTNSISTIFTMDIYASFSSKKDENGNRVMVGRVVAVAAMLLAMICAKPLLGNFDQAFQYIQEFTGFFTPGIVVIFLLGMFWKKTTSSGALAAAIGSAVLSFAFKMFWPELPFIDRVGLVFLLCVAIAVSFSVFAGNRNQDGAVSLRDIQFATTNGFNFSAVLVALILAALYATWW